MKCVFDLSACTQIWGFSEAVTLRTPLTLWFWRPAALTVGFIFFIRWCLQIQAYVEEKTKEDELKKPTQEGEPLVKAEYGTVA